MKVGSGITARLTALVVLTMSPVFVLFIARSAGERTRALAAAEAGLLADARATAGRIQAVSSEVRRFLATMALVPEVALAAPDGCALLDRAAEIDSRYLSLALVDDEGRYTCQTLDANSEGVTLADRAWVRTPLDEGLPETQVISSGRLSNETVLVLSHPVRAPTAVVTHVLGAGLNLDNLLRTSRRADFSEIVALVGTHGEFAGERVGHEILDPALGAEFLNSGSADTLVFSDPEDPHIVALVRIGTVPGLAVATVTSEAALYGPLRARFLTNLLLLALLTSASVVAAWFAAHKLVAQPLSNVSIAATSLGRGDLSVRARVTTGARELQTMARDFDQMAQALQDREHSIAKAHADLHDTHERLAHSQKLEAVGQLTGGVAHDFNNLLTVIGACLQLINQDDLSDDDKALIVQASLATQRGGDLTSRLLAFSRKQALAPATIDLNSLVLGVSELLTRVLGEAVTVNLDLAPASPICVADANQLESAILNLAINARDAMPHGGEITISTAWAENLPPHLVAGRYARLTLSDQGAGMSPEIAKRAIEPFFTTKERGSGTGLGLSGAFGFAEQSGGTLVIESEVDVGTSMHIYLPASPVTTPSQNHSRNTT